MRSLSAFLRSVLQHRFAVESASATVRQSERLLRAERMFDRITMGIHWALRQLGYKMPDEVSVIGFCDLGMSSLMDPPISSITQPSFEMGQQATSLLLDLIESKNTPASYVTRVLPSNLVLQKSSLKA